MVEEVNNTNKNALIDLLPEKPSTEILADAVDIVSYLGLAQMKTIIEKEEMSVGDKTIVVLPGDKIKALNSVINLGRLIEVRRMREDKNSFTPPEVPKEYEIE